MKGMKRALRGVPKTMVEGVAFDDDILVEPIPSNNRLLGIPEYHGTTNPTLCLFHNSKWFRKTSFTLYNVRQRDNESLHYYVRKFTAAVLDVPNAHKEVLTNTFINDLTKGPFFATLVTDPVEAYDVLLARAEKFINLEEAKSKPKSHERSPSLTQQIDQFTLLKILRSQLLMEIGASNLLRRLFRANQGHAKPKSDKFYNFHNDYDHETDECAHLRNEIRKLIKKGHLKEFLADPRVDAPHLTIVVLWWDRRKSVRSVGQTTLPLILGKGSNVKTNMVRFLVVDTPSAYKVILGKPMLNLF
ncbi:hypothetical protein CDL12_00248 [Handroanthus impetiginosus]|uniref:Retrotransposon gag domain-containing protein n=1 Tax=Handroanthus impetiginosus TaxID=429701 RepID=A0A2G9IB54_9LAMI|nr:hypothetical protein CDL12_00248 [Handroanthus impetiginosus]